VILHCFDIFDHPSPSTGLLDIKIYYAYVYSPGHLFSLARPPTNFPLLTTIIAKFMSTRTCHVQTSLIPLHHRFTSLALRPVLIVSQGQQFLAVLIRGTHSLVLGILAKTARHKVAGRTGCHGAFQVRWGNECHTTRFGTVYGIGCGSLNDLGLVIRHKLPREVRSSEIDRRRYLVAADE
jgi:hypothetical protein